MNLLDQEEKKKEPKGKKIILALLIISIILLVFAIIAMFALGEKQVKKITLTINGGNINVTYDLIITDENGLNYISIQKVAKPLGYTYSTGGYKEYSEDTTNAKCYIEKDTQIIQIEADSKKIYKTKPDSEVGFEEIELKNKVLKTGNLIYISLEDFPVALNVLYNYSQINNRIELNTIENLVESYKVSIEQQQDNQISGISEEYDNQKAISYDMLVISNSNGKWGVVDSNFNPIIGNKYDSMTFIEQEKVFIVSDNNKYGVISSEPNKKPIIDLNYEEVNVISYSPLCYEIKGGEKSVIFNKEGKLLISDAFDSIGCSGSSTEESAIVIKNIGDNKINAIVVCKDEKYGLINIDEGTALGGCVLNKVFAKNIGGQKKYFVEYGEEENKTEKSIEDYVAQLNVVTVYR